MPQPQPDPKDEQQQPQPKRPVRWIDVRFNNALVCRVNADDPTHVQVVANDSHMPGKKRLRIFEVITTSRSATGL